MKVILLALLLGGCAQIEAAKQIIPAVADQALDKTYDLTCNMRYKTEARFRARHSISVETFTEWCKR